MKELTRVRFKHERTGRRAELATDGRSGPQLRLVTAVDAVEITDGEHGPTRRFGHIPVAVNDLHSDLVRLCRVQILPPLLSMVAA
jgi:hypothetical protein